MFDYKDEEQRIQRQMANGRKFVGDLLNDLAIQLGRPEVKDFSFGYRSEGSSPDQERIIDSTGKTVATFPFEWLQDAPSTPEARVKLKARLEEATKRFFKS